MSRSTFYFTVPLQSPRRTPTPSRRTRQPDVTTERWAHMAKLYARLVEQELNSMPITEETRQWTHHPAHVQIEIVERTASPATMKRNAQTQMLEGLIRKPRGSISGREGRRHAEDARRRADEARRRTEQARLVREEFERMEARRLERAARIARRIEEEARQKEEAKRRVEWAAEMARKRELDAWRRYERQWANVKNNSASAAPLRFATIPWPVLDTPRAPSDVTEASVRAFILSQEHPDGVSRRDRIREALRRWHPDKFGRHLTKVLPSDRQSVELVAGLVVRVLNGLAVEEGH